MNRASVRVDLEGEASEGLTLLASGTLKCPLATLPDKDTTMAAKKKAKKAKKAAKKAGKKKARKAATRR